MELSEWAEEAECWCEKSGPAKGAMRWYAGCGEWVSKEGKEEKTWNEKEDGEVGERRAKETQSKQEVG